MKRFSALAVAILLAASSSFASWDYFPPNDAGEGEAKLGFYFGMPGEKLTSIDLMLGARYTIIPGLEASVKLPLPMSFSHSDIDAIGDGYAGLAYPEIGVRYWLPLVGLGFFGDFILPVDTRDDDKGYKAGDFDMVIGLQYTRGFTPLLELGTEIRLPNLINDEDFDLGIGMELDINLGIVNPFVGIELENLIRDGDMVFDLIFGAAYGINDKIGVDAFLELGLGGYGDDTPMTIGAHVSFGF
jgi:hypothetical protein